MENLQQNIVAAKLLRFKKSHSHVADKKSKHKLTYGVDFKSIYQFMLCKLHVFVLDIPR